MQKLWIRTGKAAFWLGWPLLFIYFLTQPPRTRVVIEAGGKVLFVKSWLGSGLWTLPGGGLHRGEDPVQGAIREVKEETGISLLPIQLRPLGEGWSLHHGLRFRYKSFTVKLASPAKLTPQKMEITAAEWLNKRQLEALSRFSPDVLIILSSWRSQS